MSNGNPPQGSPSKTLLQIMATRPAVNGDGTLATWFLQFLERLVNYVGPVDATSSGSVSSLGSLAASLAENQYVISGAPGIDGATQARILELENAVARLPPLNTPPQRLEPLRTQAVTEALSAAFDQVFGAYEGMILYRDAVNWQALGPGETTNLVLHTGGSGAPPFWAIPRAQGAGALASRAGGIYLGILSTGVGTTNALSDGSS